MRSSSELKIFAAPLVLLAITSVSLALVMQYSTQRYYMFMMFAGIMSAQIDLAVAWLVFGGRSYWVRMPSIMVLALGISYIMSYTFPQKADVWLGVLLIRIPGIGVPLLAARFRGAQLVHVNDPPDKKRTSLQFSLASLLTMFTTTAVYLLVGRFADYSWENFQELVVNSLTIIVSLAAIVAAVSQRHTALKVFAVLLIAFAVSFAPEQMDGPGFGPFTMMLGALIVSVMTPIMVLRMLGYSIKWLSRAGPQR